MKVKIKINGEFIEIPTIKGDDGKSVYDLAVEQGYKGTLEEFLKETSNPDISDDSLYYYLSERGTIS